MSENSGGIIANPTGIANATKESEELGARDGTYKVRFSNFWTPTSRPQNSFDLARRGEIAFLGDRFIVRAFQREMGFLGSRIELTFQRAHVADVVQSAASLGRAGKRSQCSFGLRMRRPQRELRGNFRIR